MLRMSPLSLQLPQSSTARITKLTLHRISKHAISTHEQVTPQNEQLWKNVCQQARIKNNDKLFITAYETWKKSVATDIWEKSRHSLLNCVGGHVQTDNHAKILGHLMRDGACFKPILYGITEDDDEENNESITPATFRKS
jgi:hypothetical protein